MCSLRPQDTRTVLILPEHCDACQSSRRVESDRVECFPPPVRGSDRSRAVTSSYGGSQALCCRAGSRCVIGISASCGRRASLGPSGRNSSPLRQLSASRDQTLTESMSLNRSTVSAVWEKKKGNRKHCWVKLKRRCALF